MSGVIDFIFNEGAAFLFGLLLGWLIDNGWRWKNEQRHSNWHANLFYKDNLILTRKISPAKTIQILDEPHDLTVYVKSLISPFGRIGSDIIETKGLVTEDQSNRTLNIDLSADPNFSPSDYLKKNFPVASESAEEPT